MSYFTTSTATAAAALFGFSITTTGLHYSDVSPRVLVLEQLRYNDNGTVTQQLSGGIPADWAAQITRMEGDVSHVLCSGQGRGPNYNGTEQTYTTDDWVFDECPPLQDGDIGIASWEYTDERQFVTSITGFFVVGEE